VTSVVANLGRLGGADWDDGGSQRLHSTYP
jgi:hypothetical protein